jgi:hypothetical protein
MGQQSADDQRDEPSLELPSLRLPRLGRAVPGWAAAGAGLAVGLFGAGLTYLAMAGCEAVRGTSTCGGPGLVVLLAVLAVMTLLGAVLLRAWQVAHPGSTSLLAVGLVAVVVLLLLVDTIFAAWMFLAVPVLGAGAFSLAHRVTNRQVSR